MSAPCLPPVLLSRRCFKPNLLIANLQYQYRLTAKLHYKPVTLLMLPLACAVHGGDLASTEMLNPVAHVGLLAP